MADDQHDTTAESRTPTAETPGTTAGPAAATNGHAPAPPVVPALGFGPNRGGAFSQHDYHHPAAAWGAAMSVGKVFLKQHELIDGTRAVFTMNQEGKGYDCPGCAWPDDPHGLRMDICENGLKHATWEMTKKRVGRDFFARHTVAELSTWTDFALEDAGRLTEPMSYDAATDRYVPVSWDDAFRLVGEALRGLDSPHEASFYTSGRLSNEGTFLYQLFAREFGTNNLPDCSNMCHEASGRALTASIGTGKGTVDIFDWEKTDALILLGVNAASNAPRMLTSLAEAERRGAKIVHVNPLVEAASNGTIVPHEILSMALFRSTPTSTLNVQPRIAGDMALLRGVAKCVLEAARTDPTAIDRDFLDRYTSGFDEYRALCEATPWSEIESRSGLSEATVREVAGVYLGSKATIIAWCLGVTQQERAVDTIREIVNVLLLRGNIGRPGAGPCPIRGHSNVQGNRTCGIDNHPSEAWLARMDAACGITSPRKHGLDTVRTIEGMLRGEVKVFVGMGGNFVRAVPDTDLAFDALRRCDLTVQVSTKLNKSHLVHGRRALILPCLGRTEKDRSSAGEQGVTVEDSMSMVHLSFGMKEPGSPALRSEPFILCGMARAALPDSKTPWEVYAADYDRIRDTMAEAISGFEGFNQLVRQPHGFRLPQPARERVFVTPTKRAEFSTPAMLHDEPGAGRLILSTVRSHDQWNTTIYSDDDRYRGVKNLRTLVFLNGDDMAERGLANFDLVDVRSFSREGAVRELRGYRAVRYNIPRGCATGYMPEMNVLCHLLDFSPQSDQPLMKHLIVEVVPSAARA